MKLEAPWRAVILAAGRGPDDPMAKAFGVGHKCTVPVAGKPMLVYVINALAQSTIAQPFVIVIDDAAPARSALGTLASQCDIIAAEASAPASALAAIRHINTFPVLITTGDHPLLDRAMIHHMQQVSDAGGADVFVGLATEETISRKYPETRRTYFNLGGTKVSGCNLFAVRNETGLRLLEAWQHIEKNRKNPLKLIAAFGLKPLLWFAIGRLTPERAFNLASRKLGTVIKPVFLPFAEAAIDVDKPSDHALAEKILLARAV